MIMPIGWLREYLLADSPAPDRVHPARKPSIPAALCAAAQMHPVDTITQSVKPYLWKPANQLGRALGWISVSNSSRSKRTRSARGRTLARHDRCISRWCLRKAGVAELG
jgi:hypothetical protein